MAPDEFEEVLMGPDLPPDTARLFHMPRGQHVPPVTPKQGSDVIDAASFIGTGLCAPKPVCILSHRFRPRKRIGEQNPGLLNIRHTVHFLEVVQGPGEFIDQVE